jgi:hypothetical protein
MVYFLVITHRLDTAQVMINLICLPRVFTISTSLTMPNPCLNPSDSLLANMWLPTEDDLSISMIRMQNITEAKHIILTELPRLATRAQMGTFIRQITDAPVFYILGVQSRTMRTAGVSWSLTTLPPPPSVSCTALHLTATESKPHSI